MDTMTPDILPQFLRLILALGFVLLLMGGFAYALKRLGLATTTSIKNTNKRRLKIIESLPLDPRRRLIIVKCDDREHLIVLNNNGETVIDNDIPAIAVDDLEN